ncbi:DUF5723 family protein [Labilibacter marinus]|uniref:DUF5723 family protein n=1 Tax=Labilibacter marinus TaxID=1477105 RepID=UPI0008296DED|nr:DUF5723 family protein [Labilibacter marinus]
MRKLLLVIALIYSSVALWGQGEISLYNLNYSVSQSQELNPSFYSNHKVVFGFPVLASTRASFNADQLSFNNIFSKQNNSYNLDFDKIASNLNKQNFLNLNADVQLFHLALNLKKNHFSLNFNDRVRSTLAYSDDFIKMAIYGNAHPDIIGKKIELNSLGGSQLSYHEIALGYARDINDKLTVGVKLKYLAGLTNIELKDIDGYVKTNEEEIRIKHQGFSARTAGFNLIENNEDENISTLLTNTLPGKNKNNGFAFDFGANYKINEKIKVSASIVDLGYINWNNDTKEIKYNPVDYSFKGFEILKVIDNRDSDDYIQNELDSLENLFESFEEEGIKYRSTLTAKVNAGFDYAFHPKHHVGTVGNVALFDGKTQYAIGAYYNFQPQRIFNATMNVAMRNGQVGLIGVGASVELGAFQIYGTTESLTSLIQPDAASLVSARVGINLVFGKNKAKKNKKLVIPTRAQAIPYQEPQVEEVADNELEIVDASIQKTVIPIVSPKPLSNPVIDEAPIIVSQGNHKDEIPLGHYIVVGAFLSKTNANNYSRKLTKAGFENNYGFLTEKEYYYVYVYENDGDTDTARKIRNEYRTQNQFEFHNAWLLSVVKK